MRKTARPIAIRWLLWRWFVSKNDVEKVKKILDDKWENQPLKPIPGTHVLHYAAAISSTELQVQPLSQFFGVMSETRTVKFVASSSSAPDDNDKLIEHGSTCSAAAISEEGIIH